MGKVVCPFCLHNVHPEPLFGEVGARICPRPGCEAHKRGIPLPPEVYDHKVFPIAMMGASSSGKTYFLTALLNEFTEDPAWDGDYWRVEVVHYARDTARESADNRFMGHWRRLFRQRARLDSTREGEFLAPLMVSVSYSRSGKWMMREPWFTRKLLLVFHDVPGEFTTSDDARMALAARYGALGAAAGIILLVEPREIPGLRDELVMRDVVNRDSAFARGFALDAVKGLRAAKLLAKPVAVCLSKSDLLLSVPGMLSRDTRLVQYRNTDLSHPGAISRVDMEEASSCVRYLLERFGGDRLLGLLDSSFRYSSLFAVSSLGEGVVDYKTEALSHDAPIHPLRVLDPVLWLLWQYGYLGGAD